MDPTPVSITDVGQTVVVLLLMPFAVLVGILRRLVQGRRDIPWSTDTLLVLGRCLGSVPLSIKRRAESYINADLVCNANRFRTAGHKLCQKVEREHFTGYWICQGILTGYTPPSKCDIVLYFIHGGAYVQGHAVTNATQLLRVSEEVSSKGLDLAIFSLEYDLAPEATFPRPFDQSLAAYRYLVDEQHVRPERIIVCGESAGGHLALTLLDRISDAKLAKPGAAALMFPWVDLSNSGNSFTRNQFNDVLNRSDLDTAARQACGDAGPTAFANVFDFSTAKPRGYWHTVLPAKSWVPVGSHDVFVDSIETFVKHAQEDGCDISLDIFENKPHGCTVIMDAMMVNQYTRLDPDQDVGSLMPGARLIADALLRLLNLS